MHGSMDMAVGALTRSKPRPKCAAELRDCEIFQGLLLRVTPRRWSSSLSFHTMRYPQPLPRSSWWSPVHMQICTAQAGARFRRMLMNHSHSFKTVSHSLSNDDIVN